MTPPDWPAADRAYRQHHAACPNAERQAQAQTPSSAAQRGRRYGAPINRRVIRRIRLAAQADGEETMTLPYENATSGDSALGGFGCHASSITY